jgi:iron complex transport system ATP-binding protein
VTAVVALHDLNMAAAFCDRICVMDAGRLVAVGPPAEVLTASLLAEVYRVDAEVSHHPRTGVPQVSVVPAGPFGMSHRPEADGAIST